MIFLGTGMYFITALYKAPSIIFKSCKSGAFKVDTKCILRGAQSLPVLGTCAKSHNGFLCVTLLVSYEKLTEEDLADSTFKSQIKPSSLTSAHPNYQYF